MGEQACQISNFNGTANVRISNRLSNRRSPRPGFGMHRVSYQEPSIFGRCQLSVEENIAKIQNAYRRLRSGKNLVMVVFTVSHHKILATVSQTNTSGVTLNQYLYDSHIPADQMLTQILFGVDPASDYYFFIPGRKSRLQYSDNDLCSQLTRDRIHSTLKTAKIVHLDMISQYASCFTTRRLGADARHWLDVTTLGVSGTMSQFALAPLIHDELLTAVLYADLALLHKLVATPVTDL